MQYNANPELRTSGLDDTNCSGTNSDATRNQPLDRPGYRCRDCATHVGVDDNSQAAIEFARSSAENHVATGHTVVIVDDAGAHLLTPADVDDSDGSPADDREEVR
jgi:hypothetical protein